MCVHILHTYIQIDICVCIYIYIFSGVEMALPYIGLAFRYKFCRVVGGTHKKGTPIKPSVHRRVLCIKRGPKAEGYNPEGTTPPL